MIEVSENRAMREIHKARIAPAAFTTEMEAKIKKIYEAKTRNKSEVMRLRLKGSVYTFSFFGKKNRYLCCPETRFEFFSNGFCVIMKDNAQCNKRERKYYQF